MGSTGSRSYVIISSGLKHIGICYFQLIHEHGSQLLVKYSLAFEILKFIKARRVLSKYIHL